MRSLQAALFVLLMLVLSARTFRHVYVEWLEPKGSVLDEFREPVEKDIAVSHLARDAPPHRTRRRHGRRGGASARSGEHPRSARIGGGGAVRQAFGDERGPFRRDTRGLVVREGRPTGITPPPARRAARGPP